MSEFGVSRYKQYTGGDAMMVVDGRKYRYQGTIPMDDESVGGRESRHGFSRTRELCKTVPLDAPWRRSGRSNGTGSVSRSGWTTMCCRSRRANCSRWRSPGATRPRRRRCPSCSCCIRWRPAVAGIRPGGRGRGTGLPPCRRHGGDLSAHGRRTRSLPAPFAPVHTIAQDASGVTVTTRPRVGPGAAGHRCGADRGGRADSVRAAAPGRSDVPAPADAERCDPKISVLYDEPFWARRRPVGAVRRARLAGDGDDRRGYGRAAAGGVVCDRRGASCAGVGQARGVGASHRGSRCPRRTVRPRRGHACRLYRAGLERRKVLRRRHAQPCTHRGAHRVRPCAAVAVWAHPLGRHGEFRGDVRMGRRRGAFGGAGRPRGARGRRPGARRAQPARGTA